MCDLRARQWLAVVVAGVGTVVAWGPAAAIVDFAEVLAAVVAAGETATPARAAATTSCVSAGVGGNCGSKAETGCECGCAERRRESSCGVAGIHDDIPFGARGQVVAKSNPTESLCSRFWQKFQARKFAVFDYAKTSIPDARSSAATDPNIHQSRIKLTTTWAGLPKQPMWCSM